MKTPMETITRYVETCRNGDADSLRKLFAQGAMMCGFFDGEFYIGAPDTFFNEVRNEPSPSISGEEYVGEIITGEVINKIANVTLEETNYLGSDYTIIFQLACINDSWLIVSKTYIDE